MGNQNKDIKRIKNVYKGMCRRCNNPNTNSYKYYGAKGIKVLCTKKEFIEWYLERVGDIISPHVDRKESDGHYELSNMQVISSSENAKKMLRQNPRWDVKLENIKKANERKSIKVCINNVVYPSCSAASRAFGIYRVYTRDVITNHKIPRMPDGSLIEILH